MSLDELLKASSHVEYDEKTTLHEWIGIITLHEWQNELLHMIKKSSIDAENSIPTFNWVKGYAGIGKTTLAEWIKNFSMNVVVADALDRKENEKVLNSCISSNKSCWILTNEDIPTNLSRNSIGIDEWKVERSPSGKMKLQKIPKYLTFNGFEHQYEYVYDEYDESSEEFYEDFVSQNEFYEDFVSHDADYDTTDYEPEMTAYEDAMDRQLERRGKFAKGISGYRRSFDGEVEVSIEKSHSLAQKKTYERRSYTDKKVHTLKKEKAFLYEFQPDLPRNNIKRDHRESLNHLIKKRQNREQKRKRQTIRKSDRLLKEYPSRPYLTDDGEDDVYDCEVVCGEVCYTRRDSKPRPQSIEPSLLPRNPFLYHWAKDGYHVTLHSILRALGYRDLQSECFRLFIRSFVQNLLSILSPKVPRITISHRNVTKTLYRPDELYLIEQELADFRLPQSSFSCTDDNDDTDDEEDDYFLGRYYCSDDDDDYDDGYY